MDIQTPKRNSSGVYDAFAWPGGYPLFYICADGGILCPICASLPETVNPTESQWLISAYEVNWEDDNMFCDHCSKQIESAYGD